MDKEDMKELSEAIAIGMFKGLWLYTLSAAAFAAVVYYIRQVVH